MNNNPYEPFGGNENHENSIPANEHEVYSSSQFEHAQDPMQAAPSETEQAAQRHASQQSFYTPDGGSGSGFYTSTENTGRADEAQPENIYSSYNSTSYLYNEPENQAGQTAAGQEQGTASSYQYSYYDGGNTAGTTQQGCDNTYQSPYTQPGGTIMATPYTAPGGKQKKPKKEKKKATRGFVAGMMAVGVLAAGVVGFGGGWLADNLTESGVLPSGSGLTIQKVINTASGTTENQGDAMTTEQIAEKTANSIVEITTEVVKTGSFAQQYIESGAGSGVIVSENGYIVTNNHVIDGASKITVTLKNGKSYTAKLIGSASPVLDVALLKIEESGLTPVVFGDSDSIKVGEKAVVIGNPLGQLGGTVTDGIVSALNRDLTIDGVSMNLLQTNAAINPGNSGGGMFNSKGELIGLVVAKSTGTEIEGLGFAIPVNQVTDVLDDLTEYGYVRGQIDLGMSLLDITSEQMAMMYGVNETGVYVLSVNSGSSAESAGFQRGDRIVSIDGTEVSTTDEVNKALKSHSVGDTVKVKVSRSGQTGELSLTLEESVPAASGGDSGTDNSNGFGNNGNDGYSDRNGGNNGGGSLDDFLNGLF